MGVLLLPGDRVREYHRTGTVVATSSPGLITIAWDEMFGVLSVPFRSGEQRDSIEVVPPDPRHGRHQEGA